MQGNDEMSKADFLSSIASISESNKTIKTKDNSNSNNFKINIIPPS
jgi:hypothetical protein